MAQEKEIIRIDLSQSTDAVVFKGTLDDAAENLIQKIALERVMGRINVTLAKTEDFAKSLGGREGHACQQVGWASARPRFHDVITIHGGRGSGKTTFMLNVFNLIAMDPKFCISVLPIIDPTLIESKENILVIIIAAIKREVDKKARQTGAVSTEKYKDWSEKLKDLAGGLQLLDSIGPDKALGDDWADPIWILEKGLKNARGGTQFEADFHTFIDASLRVLEKQAFLLAFDDIDTSFERGWPVLETIRKYITTPQVIVLLSGDLELYAKLVRRRQFENLGQGLLKYDRPSTTYHSPDDLPHWRDDPLKRMVDHLESQYLNKILKPANRVSLMTLQQYAQDSSYTIHVCVRSGDAADDTARIDKYLDTALQKGMNLRYTIEKLEMFRSAILKQPVRTAVQLMDALQDANSSRFLDRLTDVAASALLQVDMSLAEIHSADGDGLLWLTIKWLEDQGLWEEGYRLVPNHRDDDRNMIALILGGSLAHAGRRQPELPLLQILQLSLFRELTVESWGGAKPSFGQLVQYLDMEHVEKLSTVARRMVAVLRSVRKGDRFRYLSFRGTVPVSGSDLDRNASAQKLYGCEKKDIWINGEKPLNIKIYLGSIGSVIGDADKTWHLGVTMNTLSTLEERVGAMAPLVRLPAMLTSDTQNRSTAFYSVLGLLGCLADLMAADAEGGELTQSIRNLGQLRTYPHPQWTTSEGDGDGPSVSTRGRPRTTPAEDEPDGDAEENLSAGSGAGEGPNSGGIQAFSSAMGEWLEKIRASKDGKPVVPAYHPHVISRIGTRFYYTLQRIDEIPTKEQYTGTMMHRYIVAFLNAVLVEERLARASGDSGDQPTLSNPVQSDGIFLRNIPKKPHSNSKGSDDQDLEKAIVDEFFNNKILSFDDLPLFKSFFSCPLFALYVAPVVKIRQGSADVEWNLLEAMQQTWGIGTPDDVTKVFFQVNTRNRSAQPFAEFKNLYDLLNSVPVLTGSGAKP